MKKITLLSVSLLCSILLLFSFSSKKKVDLVITKSAVSIIECPLPEAPNLVTAAAFKMRFGAEPLMVRKSVYSLTTAEINAIKVGVLKMRSLPYTDPTSWKYQAAIHGTTMTDNLPSWNTCHRTGESFFFFAWHRMYVYFFERILRAKSGRANLAQPYWNYQLNAVLPPAYRDKTPSNPLYDGTRTAAINNGGALPASIMTAFNNSLGVTEFYTFQTNLNGGPHGSVHTTINGNMAFVTTAAQDPVFWLHHANIDRLWEEWRSRCNGRANPTDAEFLNKTYTFFDETGTPVSMKGSDVLEISTQLSYRYDDRSPVISCAAARPAVVSREPLLTQETSVEITGRFKKADFAKASSTQLETFIKTTNRKNFDFAKKNATERIKNVSERLVINFEGVSIERMPQGVVEVYLNLPEGQVPTAANNNFVGLLDLFSAEHHSMHSPQHGADVELDATKAASALGLTLPDLKNATVSFITRGATLNGKEETTEAQITIRQIRFSIDKYQK
jgi:Common central domain of tyrosinase/Polyphenol oxidase middle domain